MDIKVGKNIPESRQVSETERDQGPACLIYCDLFNYLAFKQAFTKLFCIIE